LRKTRWSRTQNEPLPGHHREGEKTRHNLMELCVRNNEKLRIDSTKTKVASP